ncbi:MAG: TolC family protein [Gemmatimonadetes bacterium]|nr:TolC family protein [Gemmatimonadota bacterium]NNM07001.1 TolC family protein [Gemmatimonadota bacterium]
MSTHRFSRAFLTALLFVFLAGNSLSGQELIPESLSLEEAVRIATRYSPLHQAELNNAEVADWNVKAAYGALLPSASAGSSLSWQGSGERQVGSVTLTELGFGNQPSYYFSSYSLGLSYTLDGRVLLALPQAKADRNAQVAQGEASEAGVVFQVTQAYLEVLRQQEALSVAQQELERAGGNLRLAEGQFEVGSGTPLDTRQAEVAVGRARVQVLVIENAVRTGKFRLAQAMGLDPQDGFSLGTEFTLAEPRWRESELVSLALERNPTLRSLRASQRVQEYSVKMARSAYLPTISLSAGTSGFAREASTSEFLVAQAQGAAFGRIANCEATNDLYSRLADPLPPTDCSQYLFTEAERRAVINQNNAFPFDFVRQPPSASFSISIPIFQGRRRQRDLETARIAEDDIQYQLRNSELALKADIASGLATLNTAFEAALLEEQNQVWADEQLRLAQERYRLGLATFLELVEAETVKAGADRDRIAAVFAYHDALASLENVVGTSLRTP